MNKYVLLTLLAFASTQMSAHGAERNNADDCRNHLNKRDRNENELIGVVGIERDVACLTISDDISQTPQVRTQELESAMNYMQAYAGQSKPVAALTKLIPFEPFASQMISKLPDATDSEILANFIISGVQRIITSHHYESMIKVRDGKKFRYIENPGYKPELHDLVEDLAPLVKR
jgi:hypothetical protein